MGSNQTIWRVLDYLKVWTTNFMPNDQVVFVQEEESTAKMAWRRAAGEAFDRAAGDPEVDDPEVDEGIGEGDARVTGTKKRRSSTLKYQTLQNLVRWIFNISCRTGKLSDFSNTFVQELRGDASSAGRVP